MCLGIPGKVVTLNRESDVAEVDFGGVRRTVSMHLCPEADVGDYVLVHVGFAIQKLEEEEALTTLELFREIGEKIIESEA